MLILGWGTPVLFCCINHLESQTQCSSPYSNTNSSAWCLLYPIEGAGVCKPPPCADLQGWLTSTSSITAASHCGARLRDWGWERDEGFSKCCCHKYLLPTFPSHLSSVPSLLNSNLLLNLHFYLNSPFLSKSPFWHVPFTELLQSLFHFNWIRFNLNQIKALFNASA